MREDGKGYDTDGTAKGLPIEWLSRAVLMWERLEVALWKPVALAVLFAGLAFFGILNALNGWLHLAVLIGFAAGILYFAFEGARRLRWPESARARRRLEKVNALEHRPLEAMEDHPSTDDPIQLALWHEHQRRQSARLTRLHLGPPMPQLARRDPLGLRFTALLVLVIALGWSGYDAPNRFADAFRPDFNGGDAARAVVLDAWVVPPEYTGLPPIFLTRPDDGAGNSAVRAANAADEQTANEQAANEQAADARTGPIEEVVSAPVGSRFILQVTGAGDAARLTVGGKEEALEPFAGTGMRRELEITESGDIALFLGEEPLARWQVAAVPDDPPTVDRYGDPTTSPQMALRLLYRAGDDYSLQSVVARFTRPGEPEDPQAIETPLPVPGPDSFGEPQSAYRDLTAHPWAGADVDLTYRAADSIGQTGESKPVTITLPEREFLHPVARALVKLRRELALAPELNRTGVRTGLRNLSRNPGAFDHDVTVYLSLDITERRLIDPDEVDWAIDMMWRTALHLEDGGLSLALARLRAAEQALQEAIARGADQAELDQLMNELQEAMNEYLQAMTEQLRERLEDGEQLPQPDQNAQSVDQRDINEMMDQIRELLRNGMHEEAERMLAQLQQMMENMRASASMQASPQGEFAEELLNEMQDIMQGQRELMDETFQRSQDGRDGERGQGQSQDGLPSEADRDARGDRNSGVGGELDRNAAARQEALRRRLGEVMRRFGQSMGEIPRPFGNAEEAMGDAGRALEQGEPGNAVDPQGRALNEMQAASEAARDAFLERFGQEMGVGQQMPGEGGQQTRDPFGRQPSANFRGPSQGDVDVPDGESLQRAREIRDELRRRAGERDRPADERDYIQRLLDQF